MYLDKGGTCWPRGVTVRDHVPGPAAKVLVVSRKRKCPDLNISDGGSKDDLGSSGPRTTEILPVPSAASSGHSTTSTKRTLNMDTSQVAINEYY